MNTPYFINNYDPNCNDGCACWLNKQIEFVRINFLNSSVTLLLKFFPEPSSKKTSNGKSLIIDIRSLIRNSESNITCNQIV